MLLTREGVGFGCLNLLRLQEIRQIARSPDDSSLLQVLRATRDFKVTNSRIKILGVLGIIGNLLIQLKDVSDYTLSTAQIYHRTALYLLETHLLSNIFAHASLQRRVSLLDMPS